MKQQDGLIIFNRQLLNSALACYVFKCSGCWLVRSLSVLSKKLKGNRKNWYITKFWHHPNELLILAYRFSWLLILNVPLHTLRGGEQAQQRATRMIRSVVALVVQYVMRWSSTRLAQELRMHFLPRTKARYTGRYGRQTHWVWFKVQDYGYLYSLQSMTFKY